MASFMGSYGSGIRVERAGARATPIPIGIPNNLRVGREGNGRVENKSIPLSLAPLRVIALLGRGVVSGVVIQIGYSEGATDQGFYSIGTTNGGISRLPLIHVGVISRHLVELGKRLQDLGDEIEAT